MIKILHSSLSHATVSVTILTGVKGLYLSIETIQHVIYAVMNALGQQRKAQALQRNFQILLPRVNAVNCTYLTAKETFTEMAKVFMVTFIGVMILRSQLLGKVPPIYSRLLTVISPFDLSPQALSWGPKALYFITG